MITTELDKELREWLRPISPLTAFAKSVRGEGPTDGKGAASEENASKKEDASKENPLAGLDLDELPTDIREKITAAQKVLEDTKKVASELTTKQQQTENFARQMQSRADKLEGIVKSHNLPIDGQQKQQQQSPLDTKIQARFDSLKAGGMEEKAAMAYAKMLAEESMRQEQEILSRIAPLVGSVGSLQADQVLQSAKGAYQQVFSIPELSQQIHQNVQNLVGANQPVTKETMDHLVSMAWGQHVLKNPDAMKQQQQQNQQIPNFGNLTIQHGGLPNNPGLKEDNKPTVTQPETVTIISALNAEMMRGLPKKK